MTGGRDHRAGAEAAGPKVLVVEDDPSVREAVTIVLERSGLVVHSVADGADAVASIGSTHEPDLVMLPSISGFDVCRQIRETSRVPIIMLTARADSDDVIAGLRLGADDYVTKPFEPAELAARVHAVLRRWTSDTTPRSAELRGRDLVIDEVAFRAVQRGDEVRLTTVELRLLVALVHHAGEVLTRQALLQKVWGYDYLGDSRLVDMAIKRLRDRLGDAPHGPPYITTVRGVGYRFERG